MLADVGVPDIGQVRHFGTGADHRVLGLDERAQLALGAQAGTRPQIGEWSDVGPIADHGVAAVRSDHRGAVADRNAGQGRVRADGGPSAHPGAPEQLGARVDDSVAADRHVDVDPGGGRIDDGDPGPLVGGHDAPVQLSGEVGQLHPVIDAGHQGGVVDVLGTHHLPIGSGDRNGVGQIQLVLRVVCGQPAQCGAERADVEGVDACIDLADGALLIGGVGLLDNRDHLAVLCAQNPAVAPGVRHRGGQHRDSGGFAGRASAVRGDQSGEGVGVEQRDVTGGDHHHAIEVGGQCRQPAQRGMTGAQLLLLHRHLDRAAEVGRKFADHRRDALAILAEYDDQVLRGEFRDRVQRVREHAAPAERVQHLGVIRAHPGAGTGRQHQHRGLTGCRHVGPPRSAGSVARTRT